jgi:hypothetical protein
LETTRLTGIIFPGIHQADMGIPADQQIIRVMFPVIPHQDIPQFKD